MKTFSAANARIESIDLLRGLVMIIMALDHVRGYFHFESFLFSPTDIEKTTPAIFASRLITHLCAPAFIFLAGTSAYFIAQRKTIEETSRILIMRGLWLVLLQVTIVDFGWNFDPQSRYIASSIISTIGFCMISLAFLVKLKFKTILVIGGVMVLGHNALDSISFESGSMLEIVWAFIHGKKFFTLGNGYNVQLLYPLIPWIGVMALGYCFGSLYTEKYTIERRRQILIITGAAILLSFVILRTLNFYGDPVPWRYMGDYSKTIMSFLNLEKYPPSLFYLGLTLGISILILGLVEGQSLPKWKPVILFGKVALFYYVLHIFVIHTLALIVVTIEGFPWQSMIFIGVTHTEIPNALRGSYGFNIWTVFLIWIGIVLLLYPACVYWSKFKIKHKSKWWVAYV